MVRKAWGILLAISIGMAMAGPVRAGSVTLEDLASHYRVIIDLTDGSSLADIAEEYAGLIKEAVPNMDELVDSYLADVSQENFIYEILLFRADIIRSNLEPEYRNLLDRMGAALASTTESDRGDGQLSAREYLVLALLTDVLRLTQCSAVSVFGGRSETGNTLTVRNLEWATGSRNQLPQLQATTTIREAAGSVFSVGYLGYFGVLTGLNSAGIFAAVLDSDTLFPYTSLGKTSYVFDLLSALRSQSTLDRTAHLMTDPNRKYAFNHNIFLSDSQVSKVLENNISGWFGNPRRAVRTSTSELNPGVSWPFPQAIAAVNSFVLKGNTDNHTLYDGNRKRWDNFKTLLSQAGEQVGFEKLKEIASFKSGPDPGADPGDIYRGGEQQMIALEPATGRVEVFFRPKSGGLPDQPSFEPVDPGL